MKRVPNSTVSQSSFTIPIIMIVALICLLYLLSSTSATSFPIGGIDLDQVRQDEVKKLNHEEAERQRKQVRAEFAEKHQDQKQHGHDHEGDHSQQQHHQGSAGSSSSSTHRRPRVQLQTAIGSITFELRPDAAPQTVENFLKLVKDGFYGPKKGASFYRAEMHDTEPRYDFCLQGGGWPVKGSPFPPVKHEYKLPNVKYAVSMARTNDPNSATSEFSIMLNDNSKWLGPHGSEPYGYAVFAHVVDGFELIEKIRKMKREKKGGLTYLKDRVEFTGAKIL